MDGHQNPTGEDRLVEAMAAVVVEEEEGAEGEGLGPDLQGGAVVPGADLRANPAAGRQADLAAEAEESPLSLAAAPDLETRTNQMPPTDFDVECFYFIPVVTWM
jgi:hypothetical protein